MEPSSSDPSEVLIDKLCETERFAKRKADWDNLFETFKKYDQNPELDKEYDIRDEKEVENYVSEFGCDTDLSQEDVSYNQDGHSYSGDESDNGLLFNDLVEDDPLENISLVTKSDTTSYYAEDEISKSEETKRLEIWDRTSPVYQDCIETQNRSQYTKDHGVAMPIITGSCEACGTSIYLPYNRKNNGQRNTLDTPVRPTRKFGEGQCLEKNLCIKCLSKEIGHDDCTKENCLTCQEFAKRVETVQFLREKFLHSHRKKLLQNQLNRTLRDENKQNAYNVTPYEFTDKNVRSENDMKRLNSSQNFIHLETHLDRSVPFVRNSDANDYSFEENRFQFGLYRTSIADTHSASSSPSYTEKGYETDSSYSYSSLSSCSGDYRYAESSFKNNRAAVCVICKINVLHLKPSSYSMEHIVPICHSCSHGHMDCKKNECKTCFIIAKTCSRISSEISFKYRRRKSRSRLALKGSQRSLNHLQPQDPNSSSFIDLFQDQNISHKHSSILPSQNFLIEKESSPSRFITPDSTMQNPATNSSMRDYLPPRKGYKISSQEDIYDWQNNKSADSYSECSSGSSNAGLMIEKSLNMLKSPTVKSKKRFLLKTPNSKR